MYTLINKTEPDYKVEGLKYLSTFATATVESYKRSYQASFDMLWNKTKYSAQDIFDLLGTDAAQLFVTANKVINHIRDLDPSYEPPMPTATYTINDDGTVTVLTT